MVIVFCVSMDSGFRVLKSASLVSLNTMDVLPAHKMVPDVIHVTPKTLIHTQSMMLANVSREMSMILLPKSVSLV